MRVLRIELTLWLFVALLTLPCSRARSAEEDIPYGVAATRWPPTLGNHRACIRVEQKAEAVLVRIPWRRRDAEPEKKNVVIVDAATGDQVRNRVVMALDRYQGQIVFQPPTVPGDYYVYYMPFSENKTNWQYQTHYAPPEQTAEAAWLEAQNLTDARLAEPKWSSLPQAKVVRMEAWSEFHRFDPMEMVATPEEVQTLLAAHADRPYLVFPEDRTRPIRMTDDLPLCWIGKGPTGQFAGDARPGEFYAFQLGLFAARADAEDVAVEISDFQPPSGPPIPAAKVHAFNFRGTDWLGRPMVKSVSVPRGKVAPLWFGLRVPDDAAQRTYAGTITLRPKGLEPSTVEIALKVSGEVLKDGGASELWRQARLEWLDSTIGLDDEVVAPYTPVEVDGRSVRCLGRTVRFAESGLPQSIQSNRREILARPMSMIVETADGPAAFTGAEVEVAKTAPAAATVQANGQSGPFTVATWAKMEADGYVNVRVTFTARGAVKLNDLRLEIPFQRDVAKYMMGLGHKGGLRSGDWQWKWDIGRANNMLWVGDADAGLQCKLKGPKDTWDIYDLRAGGLPKSWDNDGRGGCTVTETPGAVLLRAFSGPREVAAGEELEFRFGLLVTPVKPLDPAHWSQRYYHYYAPVVPVDKVAETGANIINCHQGNELNPYINYPFLTTDQFAAYVREAHAKGIKVKTYYTVRELSNYVAEMWALRSLGTEVFADGPGGGHSWLCEHLVSHYTPAWHQPYPNGDVDAAIVTTGLSRWHNYYLEGLSWLVNNVGLDGLYLDGIGYDREIMKRVRKVMDRARPGCLIDFHSGNEFPFNDLRVSPANKYMEHFPYINSLWFGEGYDYNEAPDYWLVEVSGIPFGLYGEMLQGGGNPWRGMVYGMTSRLGWGGDPRPVWKVWDEFGIQDSQTLGYWDPACPVKTDHADVLATAYVKPGKTLVAVASWAKGPVKCRLAIDWQRLGLDPQKAHLYAPAAEGFQPAALFAPTDAIPVFPARGWLLIVDEAPHEAPPAVRADVYERRTLLLEDRFDRAELGEPWKTSLSTQPGTSLKLAEGGMTIEAAANAFAFAERPLPAEAALVECLLFSGSDKGASWGTGLAVVWPDRVLRVNLRAEGRYGIDPGTNDLFAGMTAPDSWYHVRIRLEDKEVLVEASSDGDLWYPLYTFPRSRFPGYPAAVRVGKMAPAAKAEDFSLPGPAGTSVVKSLRVFGPQRAQ